MSYIYGAPSKVRNSTSYVCMYVCMCVCVCVYIYIWTGFITGDFASCTVHFVNICVVNQQIHQLFI
jgi:hypothetical protein